MSISLEQIEAFSATVEKGSFKQAGQKLGKAASTISNLVSNLELDINLQLFVRHARYLEQTEDARALYAYAQSVLDHISYFKDKAEALNAHLPGQLTLAVDASLHNESIGHCVVEIVRLYPSVDLSVLTGDSLEVRNMVLDNTADLGLCIATLGQPPELVLAQSFTFSIAYVIAPDFPGYSARMSRQQLLNLPKVVYKAAEALGMDDKARTRGRRIQASNSRQITDLVLAGVGWAGLPRYRCQQLLDSGQLIDLNLEHEGPLTLQSNVIWRVDRPLTPPQKKLLELLRNLPDR